MPNVYIDMIKHAIPAGMRKFVGEHDAQYVVFGSYDLLHYALPGEGDQGQLQWLERQHEERHDLDWNYERHPMSLYCPASMSDQLRRVLDPQTNPTHPLVLSMARMVKHPLLQAELDLDATIDALQRHLAKLLEEQSNPDMAIVACWNLGNADFVLLSRPRRLGLLRDLFLPLEDATFQIPCKVGKFEDSIVTKFCSLSSYCAFPASLDVPLCVSEDDLRSWLGRDESLGFTGTVDWLPNARTLTASCRTDKFLFGDRDFQYDASSAPIDLILQMLKEMLDPTHEPTILSSSLTPSLPMADAAPTPAAPTGEAKGVPTYDMEWDDLSKPMYMVIVALTRMREAAEEELDAHGCGEATKERHLGQLQHCQNTLYSLYWHAMRLHAAAYQDDILQVVMRLYDALATTIDSYRRHIESQRAAGNESRFARAIPDLYVRVMQFVSELQHVYTVLAISPHSYMETYYGSMRSLNASSKLWASYNGVIRAICDLFPLTNDYKQQRCSVLLVPYRERQSKSSQIFPALNSADIVVLLQLNYPMMFDAKRATFVIVHELGHYLFNTTRKERCGLLFEATVVGALLNNQWGDALKRPLFYLFSVMDLDGKGAASKLEEDKERLAADPNGRELPNLDVYASLDDDAYASLYGEMNADLEARYKKALTHEAAACLKDFTKSSAQLLGSGPGSNAYHGRNVVDAIGKYVTRNADKIVRRATKGIIDASVDFLQGISRYEEKYDLQFGLYSLARTKAYWVSRQEDGHGGGAATVGYPTDLIARWCDTVLDVFRETHADVFACKVADYSIDDYLEHVSMFAYSNPKLIATYRDLIRIMIVCEAVFEDAGCARLTAWAQDPARCRYEDGVRSEAQALIASSLTEPHHAYLLEYGKDVTAEVDRRIVEIRCDEQESALLDAVQDFVASDEDVMRYLWRFWLYAMRRG